MKSFRNHRAVPHGIGIICLWEVQDGFIFAIMKDSSLADWEENMRLGHKSYRACMREIKRKYKLGHQFKIKSEMYMKSWWIKEYLQLAKSDYYLPSLKR